MFCQLEEEIEKMISMDGLRRKDHVLELNRLMLRAESVEHRLSLLKIIQVVAAASANIAINCCLITII